MKKKVIILPILGKEKVIMGFELSTGERFSELSGLLKHLTAHKKSTEFFYEDILPLASLLGRNGYCVSTSPRKLTLESGVKITSMHDWLEPVQTREEAVKALANSTSGSPAMQGIRSLVQAMGRLKGMPLLLDEALLMVRDYPGSGRDWVPAYRGGLTVNAAEIGKLYKGLKSYDLSSAYPSIFVSSSYPVDKSREVEVSYLAIADGGSIKGLKENEGFIAKVRFTGLKRKDWVRLSVLQHSTDLEREYAEAEFDELGLTTGNLIIAVTPPDLASIQLQYDYSSATILECYAHRMGMPSSEVVQFFKGLYQEKTVGGEIEKKKINSITGAIGRSPFIFMDREATDLATAEKYLNVYNGGPKKSPVSMGGIRKWDMRWAIYVNARMRYVLARTEKALFDRGCEVLYCDTDSIKFRGEPGDLFTNFNDQISKIIRCGDLGQWKDESGEYSDGAIFYGKKQYLKSSDGVIEPTLAGLNKEDARGQLAGTSIAALEGKPVYIDFHVWRPVKVVVSNGSQLLGEEYSMQFFKYKYPLGL